MGMGEDEKIQQRIDDLHGEHQTLDRRITHDSLDQMSLQRLKKRKLFIKDEIARLCDYLEPDIIA